MSTAMARRGGGGGRQFPVGRRRHVPVVDSGCGCRPRRPRLLSLASFIWPSSASCKQAAAKVPARGAGGSPYYFRSSSSAASFSSSSAATTYSTGYSSASYYSSSNGAGHGGAPKKEEEEYLAPPPKVKATTKAAAAAAGKRPQQSRKKKTGNLAAAEDDGGGVGVAVEKESSDPRADFRESMVQIVVEMGLCHWDDLRCMLRRLLALNAPSHHAAILTAFAEVCAQLAAPSPPPAYGHHHRR
ncbi:hypothetical protein E2562_034717 [Oryza meyeriana var. granulata]|uniref:Transcription repressor n=1 Tax=Oryza meyeriana var. granulata TaxID=110450 RepID=A0A6G1C9S1_9ORYZ|nr:hypothetical protein E2562_034717 [Oryza meyeriana var. granulata]